MLACLAAAGIAQAADGPRPAPSRPNVVVIMSDDESVSELPYQRHVVDEIGDRGATFTNSFVNFSLCCPSRSTFLTGLYAHNHHVLTNFGFRTFERLDSHNDLPLWLHAAGYHTGLVGKYLNGYEAHTRLIPPGWDEWYGVGQAQYYDYTQNENGRLVHFGGAPSDYLDDVITRESVDFIRRNASGPLPFFLFAAYKAPHGATIHPSGDRCAKGVPEPPPRHFGQFASTPLPEPPSFNEADVTDKPQFVRSLPRLTPEAVGAEQANFQCALEALQGVDDGVRKIIAALGHSGVLRDTYVIYTSDNGLFHGEHRIYGGKETAYEPSIRVPLLMRGPGIPAGEEVGDLAINADLAPTIVDVAGARAHRVMNGMSLIPAARHPNHLLGRELLIEAGNPAVSEHAQPAPPLVAIRTQRYVFIQYDDGEQELYDLATDPYELQNQAANPAYAQVRSLLATELSRLSDCRRAGCRRLPQLRIALRYHRAHSRLGGPCALGPVTARLAGGDSRLLVGANFTLNGRATRRLQSPPFRLVVPHAVLARRRQVHLHAAVGLLDGRELTLSSSLPPRCASGSSGSRGAGGP
jgi:N-acetylglucosamine-6-sulfatase